ncbi:MAG: hypothetical protein OHK0044_01340 [Burkholderiaceae bacterium]
MKPAEQAPARAAPRRPLSAEARWLAIGLALAGASLVALGVGWLVHPPLALKSATYVAIVVWAAAIGGLSAMAATAAQRWAMFVAIAAVAALALAWRALARRRSTAAVRSQSSSSAALWRFLYSAASFACAFGGTAS